MNIVNLNHNDILDKAEELSKIILQHNSCDDIIKIYPVPRGGISCAYILLNYLPDNFMLTDNISDANIVIDDIEDSGQTKEQILKINKNINFYTFFNAKDYDCWLSFPWERTLDNKDLGIEQELLRISQHMNISVEDVERRLGY